MACVLCVMRDCSITVSLSVNIVIHHNIIVHMNKLTNTYLMVITVLPEYDIYYLKQYDAGFSICIIRLTQTLKTCFISLSSLQTCL